MVRLVLLITLLPALTLGADYSLKECEGVPLPTDFSVAECPNGRPCNAVAGKPLRIQGTFQLDHPVTSLPSVVEAIRPNGEIIQLELPTGDACNGIAGGCPLDPGTHTISSPVGTKGVNPGETVTVRIVIRDQDKKVVTCVASDGIFH